MRLFPTPLNIACVLDLSSRRIAGGERIIDRVKEQMISVLKEFEDDDVFIAHGPNGIMITENSGGHVCTMSEQEPEVNRTLLGHRMSDLNQCFWDDFTDKRWGMLIITDRYSEKDHDAVRSAIKWHGVNVDKRFILVMAVGIDCDFEVMKQGFGNHPIIHAGDEAQNVAGIFRKWTERIR